MKRYLNLILKMHTDLDKTRDIGKILLERVSEGPEFIKPEGLSPLEYRRWLTVVVALDYLKDADKLWAAARKALESEHRMVFEFWWLRQNPVEKVAEYLKDSKLSIFFNKDAKYLKQIAEKMKWYVDDPLAIIRRNDYDGAQVLEALQEFPYLRGKKLSLFWLRIMHDLVTPKLNIFGVSIPVDVHVAKLTLRTGCIKFDEDYKGTVGKITPAIQTCWDLTAMILETYPSKFDEPLWSISKYICPNCPEGCPIEKYCDKLNVHVTSKQVLVDASA